MHILLQHHPSHGFAAHRKGLPRGAAQNNRSVSPMRERHLSEQVGLDTYVLHGYPSEALDNLS